MNYVFFISKISDMNVFMEVIEFYAPAMLYFLFSSEARITLIITKPEAKNNLS